MNETEGSQLQTDEAFKLPDGATVVLRVATEDDDPFLVRLYAITREPEFVHVEWPQDQKEIFLNWQFDLQRKEYRARYPDSANKLIIVDGEPAGRIWGGSDEKQIRLLDLAILPEFQRRGIGTILLKYFIEQAQRERKLLRHMVFMLNDDAHRLYERLGFVEIEQLGAYKHMEWRPAGG